MTNHNQIIQSLKARGVRLTPQRLLILSAIAEGGGHLAVDEIYRRAREAYPYMDIATVYRTLHRLKKMGVVTEVGMEDRLHFELTSPDHKHHHMVCRQCGRALDLSPIYLKAFRKTLVDRFGFQPDLDNFTVTGVCGQCAPAKPRRKKGAEAGP